MISKRALGCDLMEVPAVKRLQRDLADLFLSNSVLGARAAALFQDAEAAGSIGVSDLSRKACSQELLEEVAEKEQMAKRAPRIGAGVEQADDQGVPRIHSHVTVS